MYQSDFEWSFTFWEEKDGTSCDCLAVSSSLSTAATLALALSRSVTNMSTSAALEWRWNMVYTVEYGIHCRIWYQPTLQWLPRPALEATQSELFELKNRFDEEATARWADTRFYSVYHILQCIPYSIFILELLRWTYWWLMREPMLG